MYNFQTIKREKQVRKLKTIQKKERKGQKNQSVGEEAHLK